jgi:hypothetical protein
MGMETEKEGKEKGDASTDGFMVGSVTSRQKKCDWPLFGEKAARLVSHHMGNCHRHTGLLRRFWIAIHPKPKRILVQTTFPRRRIIPKVLLSRNPPPHFAAATDHDGRLAIAADISSPHNIVHGSGKEDRGPPAI